jgi:hypothetical protein
MKIQGERIEERIVVEKILRYMGTRFNYVVCAIEESNNIKLYQLMNYKDPY